MVYIFILFKINLFKLHHYYEKFLHFTSVIGKPNNENIVISYVIVFFI